MLPTGRIDPVCNTLVGSDSQRHHQQLEPHLNRPSFVLYIPAAKAIANGAVAKYLAVCLTDHVLRTGRSTERIIGRSCSFICLTCQ